MSNPKKNGPSSGWLAYFLDQSENDSSGEESDDSLFTAHSGPVSISSPEIEEIPIPTIINDIGPITRNAIFVRNRSIAPNLDAFELVEDDTRLQCTYVHHFSTDDPVEMVQFIPKILVAVFLSSPETCFLLMVDVEHPFNAELNDKNIGRKLQISNFVAATSSSSLFFTGCSCLKDTFTAKFANVFVYASPKFGSTLEWIEASLDGAESSETSSIAPSVPENGNDNEEEDALIDAIDLTEFNPDFYCLPGPIREPQAAIVTEADNSQHSQVANVFDEAPVPPDVHDISLSSFEFPCDEEVNQLLLSQNDPIRINLGRVPATLPELSEDQATLLNKLLEALPNELRGNGYNVDRMFHRNIDKIIDSDIGLRNCLSLTSLAFKKQTVTHHNVLGLIKSSERNKFVIYDNPDDRNAIEIRIKCAYRQIHELRIADDFNKYSQYNNDRTKLYPNFLVGDLMIARKLCTCSTFIVIPNPMQARFVDLYAEADILELKGPYGEEEWKLHRDEVVRLAELACRHADEMLKGIGLPRIHDQVDWTKQHNYGAFTCLYLCPLMFKGSSQTFFALVIPDDLPKSDVYNLRILEIQEIIESRRELIDNANDHDLLHHLQADGFRLLDWLAEKGYIKIISLCGSCRPILNRATPFETLLSIYNVCMKLDRYANEENRTRAAYLFFEEKKCYRRLKLVSSDSILGSRFKFELSKVIRKGRTEIEQKFRLESQQLNLEFDDDDEMFEHLELENAELSDHVQPSAAPIPSPVPPASPPLQLMVLTSQTKEKSPQPTTTQATVGQQPLASASDNVATQLDDNIHQPSTSGATFSGANEHQTSLKPSTSAQLATKQSNAVPSNQNTNQKKTSRVVRLGSPDGLEQVNWKSGIIEIVDQSNSAGIYGIPAELVSFSLKDKSGNNITNMLQFRDTFLWFECPSDKCTNHKPYLDVLLNSQEDIDQVHCSSCQQLMEVKLNIPLILADENGDKLVVFLSTKEICEVANCRVDDFVGVGDDDEAGQEMLTNIRTYFRNLIQYGWKGGSRANYRWVLEKVPLDPEQFYFERYLGAENAIWFKDQHGYYTNFALFILKQILTNEK